MKYQYIDIGEAGNDNSGDYPPDAGAKVNKNFQLTNEMVNFLAKVAAVGIIAGVGDSNTGHMHSAFASSPYYQTIIGRYNADAYVPTEWAFSAPGQRSDYVLANMVPALKAKIEATGVIPRMCDVSTGQNDGVVRFDIARNTYANTIATVQGILALGIPWVVLWGPLPDPKLLGKGRPEALDWLNTALMIWSNKTPGVIFINALELAKDRTNAGESATSSVWWMQGKQANGEYVKTHGSQPGLGAIGSTGIDNEHPAMYFGWRARPYLEPILRMIFPEMPRPDLTSAPYDPAYNPLGNYLGPRGMFLGTGGLWNGVASDNVPAGWEITVDLSAIGPATIQPSIVVGPYGDREMTISGDGIPASSPIIKCATKFSHAAPTALWLPHVTVRRKMMRGFSGFTIAGGGFGIGTAAGLANILPEMAHDELKVRGMEPKGWGNTFNSQEFSCSTAVVAGVALEGSIAFSRFSHTIKHAIEGQTPATVGI